MGFLAENTMKKRKKTKPQIKDNCGGKRKGCFITKLPYMYSKKAA
jgi:hypothetical protein